MLYLNIQNSLMAQNQSHWIIKQQMAELLKSFYKFLNSNYKICNGKTFYELSTVFPKKGKIQNGR